MQAHIISREKIKADFNAAAPRYNAHAVLQRDVARRLCGKVSGYLADGGNILDIGAGTGFVSQYLCTGQRQITQLDIAMEMCQVAQNFGPSINADMHNLPFQENSFPAIISSLALQWSDNLPRVCEGMYNILEGGGVCAVATFGSNTLHELNSLGVSSRAIPFVTLEKLKSIFFDNGFEVLLAESEISLHSYRDVYTLLYSIKNIGARNKAMGSGGFPGKKFFNRLDSRYRCEFPSPEGGIRATWEVLYLIACKV